MAKEVAQATGKQFFVRHVTTVTPETQLRQEFGALSEVRPLNSCGMVSFLRGSAPAGGVNPAANVAEDDKINGLIRWQGEETFLVFDKDVFGFDAASAGRQTEGEPIKNCFLGRIFCDRCEAPCAGSRTGDEAAENGVVRAGDVANADGECWELRVVWNPGQLAGFVGRGAFEG